jgi:hypothetical protein
MEEMLRERRFSGGKEGDVWRGERERRSQVQKVYLSVSSWWQDDLWIHYGMRMASTVTTATTTIKYAKSSLARLAAQIEKTFSS